MRPTPRKSLHGPAGTRLAAAPALELRRTIAGVLSVALAATWVAVALLVAGNAKAADEPPVIELLLRDLDGEGVGTVVLRELPGGGVHLDAMFDALPSGVHGFHLHETGVCDAADGFESAGGHLAGERKHGFLVEGGPHPGDMPNVHVPDTGALHVEVINTLVTLAGSAEEGADGRAMLLDADGSALMVHSGADDYTSQPSGAAGERIACAEIVSGG